MLETGSSRWTGELSTGLLMRIARCANCETSSWLNVIPLTLQHCQSRMLSISAMAAHGLKMVAGRAGALNGDLGRLIKRAAKACRHLVASTTTLPARPPAVIAAWTIAAASSVALSPFAPEVLHVERVRRAIGQLARGGAACCLRSCHCLRRRFAQRLTKTQALPLKVSRQTIRLRRCIRNPPLRQ